MRLSLNDFFLKNCYRGPNQLSWPSAVSKVYAIHKHEVTSEEPVLPAGSEHINTLRLQLPGRLPLQTAD